MSSTIETLILRELSNSENSSISDSLDFASAHELDHTLVVGVLKSLDADQLTTSETFQREFWQLTEEGMKILNDGSPEFRVYSLVSSETSGLRKSDIQSKIPPLVANLGISACMKNKWLKITEEGYIVQAMDVQNDVTKEKLAAINNPVLSAQLSTEELKELKKRKLVTQVVRKPFKICRGPRFSVERRKKAADLSKEMLESGEWKNVHFREYNFSSLGFPVGGGYLHPLLKVREEFRKILMQMGFEEMPTNRWVESSFWNFDVLFQPQSHPARDAHDTFFVKDPASTLYLPEVYLESVKNIHEKGGAGSIGYRYEWRLEEAKKNLLRTHTTAISSQMLKRLADEKVFTPKRYFSIDRVFRNESMDATHLCEFHQVEGLVADRNLSLGDLIGTIKYFFEKIGITQVRFKPAYNPYTEPSMEIFGYHPDLKRWTEIGNSGIFRPEMLKPMGLPDDVRVIAWGLSLERPTMIKYRMNNIRDLFGHKANLSRTRNAPICRFDVE